MLKTLHLQGDHWVPNLLFSPKSLTAPDSNVHRANMGPIWGWQDPGGPHVGSMNLAIWDYDTMHVECRMIPVVYL